jgi:hypothetical protein
MLLFDETADMPAPVQASPARRARPQGLNRRTWVAGLVVTSSLGAVMALTSPDARAESNARTDVVEDARMVEAFKRLSVKSGLEVILVAAPQSSVTVVGTPKSCARIETTVRGSTLVVGQKASMQIGWVTSPRVKIVVGVPVDFESVGVEGSGQVHGKALKFMQFDARVTGSGDIRLEKFEARTFSGSIRGSGDLTVDGSADSASFEVSGAGDIRAQDMQVKRVKVAIAGSGDVRVWATDTLDVNIAGAGDVRYRGKPTLRKSIAGAGDIEPLN